MNTSNTSSVTTPDPLTAGEPTPLLELRNVTRTFTNNKRTTTALDNVTLTVNKGQSLGIVGESGAGKSTILKLLMGLDSPTAGEVRFEGAPLNRRNRQQMVAFRQAVQIVFQDPRSSLDPRMTVAKIIAEPLVSLKVSGNHRDRVREVLTSVGLDESALTKYPAQFSGGQRQRIAIARALAPAPSVLVADEPVSALDVSVRAQIVDLLADLTSRLGVTLVMVSHDIAIVGQLCARTAVLRAGRIEEQGDTLQVLTEPTAQYTRDLINAVPQMPPYS